jgi:predicted transcriptional regulator
LTDPWHYWRETLAGKQLPIHEGHPQPGFYRWPSKTGYGARKTFTPVAYWPENTPDNQQVTACRIGDEDVTPERGAEIWVSVARHPVLEEAYRGVAERGELWPDEPESASMQKPHPMIGHNRPPDDVSYVYLSERINDATAEAKRFLDGEPITAQFQADLIANCADRLAELHKMADQQRAAERKPHDEVIKVIQQKWSPLLVAAEVYKNLKYKLLTPWLQQQAREAAERAAQSGDTTQIERPKAGTRGRAMSLKSLKRAEITDYDLCLNHFRNAPDIKATVQDLANKAVRSGLEVPGAKLLEETKAV